MPLESSAPSPLAAVNIVRPLGSLRLSSRILICGGACGGFSSWLRIVSLLNRGESSMQRRTEDVDPSKSATEQRKLLGPSISRSYDYRE